jgi:hypothetical protein
MSTRTEDATSSINPRHPGLKHLERMVGRWKITGGAPGEISYEWLPGGHFLIARGAVEMDGNRQEHMEIIGYDRSVDAKEPSDTLTSRLYTSSGQTLSYTHEIDEKGLTSWFGEKGSTTVMRARWTDENTLSGAWEWPGGGYDLKLTRIR